MTIDVKLRSGKGVKRYAAVELDGSVRVTSTGVPVADTNISLRPFSAFLLNSAGSNDLRVDGSVNNQEFFIQAPEDGDRYIHTIAFTIADAGAALNEFGNLSALSNGCQLILEDNVLGDVTLGDDLVTNFDFVQLCGFEPMFGSGTDSFKASNVTGASEAFIPILDVEDQFGLPFGLRLPKLSVKKLKVVVRDDLTGVDRFDVKIFGYDRIEVTNE